MHFILNSRQGYGHRHPVSLIHSLILLCFDFGSTRLAMVVAHMFLKGVHLCGKWNNCQVEKNIHWEHSIIYLQSRVVREACVTCASASCHLSIHSSRCFCSLEELDKKRPLSLRFEIPYFTTSGIQVRYLKITERSGYQALPWVRYITQNGGISTRTTLKKREGRGEWGGENRLPSLFLFNSWFFF